MTRNGRLGMAEPHPDSMTAMRRKVANAPHQIRGNQSYQCRIENDSERTGAQTKRRRETLKICIKRRASRLNMLHKLTIQFLDIEHRKISIEKSRSGCMGPQKEAGLACTQNQDLVHSVNAAYAQLMQYVNVDALIRLIGLRTKQIGWAKIRYWPEEASWVGRLCEDRRIFDEIHIWTRYCLP